MKRFFSAALLLSVILTFLAACDGAKPQTAPAAATDSAIVATHAASESVSETEREEPAEIPEPVYHFRYDESFLNQTAAISGVIYDVPARRDHALVFPETLGDNHFAVNAILVRAALPIPYWITVERFTSEIEEPLRRAVKGGKFTAWNLDKFLNLYIEMNPEKEPENAVSIIQTFPITAEKPIYILDSQIASSELKFVYSTVRDYTCYSYDDLAADSAEIGFEEVIREAVCAAYVTSVSLPSGLFAIPNNLLMSCPRLEEIRYAGTVAQWEELAAARDLLGNRRELPDLPVQCADGVWSRK